MKIKLIIIAYFLLSTRLIAQENPKWLITAAFNGTEAQLGNPVWHSWGYGYLNVNNYNGVIKNRSYSFSIIPKYAIKDQVYLRFEAGYSHIKILNSNYNPTYNPSPAIIETNQNISQNIYRFAPGIQWNFIESKKVKAYCGINVSYLQYSNIKYDQKLQMWDLSKTTLIQGNIDNYKAKGGFATGLGSFIGFNIQLLKNISLGAETSVSYLYYHLGGTYTDKSVSLTNPNDVSFYSFNASSRGFQFSTLLPSLNITVDL